MTRPRKKAAAKTSDKPHKRLTTEERIARIKKLPEGTKERAAYEELGTGVSREEFREEWLTHRLGVSVQPPAKAPKTAEKDAAPAAE